MRILFQKSLIIICSLLTISTFAQKKVGIIKNDSIPSNELVFGNYFSNYVGFDGRKFGTNQWLLTSSLAYLSKSGWGFAAQNSYWSQVPNSSAVFELNMSKKVKTSQSSELTIGYQKEFISKENTYLERKILTNDVTANFSIDKKYYLISLDGGYLFGGGKTAYYTSLELRANIEKEDFLGADNISVQPGIEIIGGTFDVFNRTISHKIIKKSKTTSNGGFDLLDYDFFVPLQYTKGKFDFTLEYHYNIPIQSSTETLSPFSYVILKVDFKILGH